MWLLIFIGTIAALSYHRSSLKVWTVAIAAFYVLWIWFSTASVIPFIVFAIIAITLFTFAYKTSWRQKYITHYILEYYRKIMPTMSRTEQEALAAGTVGWEKHLFCGEWDVEKLLHYPAPTLSVEEQAFLDGPVEELCRMTNDWDITQYRYDLPPEIWKFIKEQGFYGLIIPKKFGGKEFSAYAHSQVLTKLYGVSATVASTVSVPNSLGPAELLLHYGTEQQKNYYLPRLASGEEIPCFALTAPEAGSDAGAMIDTGVVCWGEYQGKKILGIRLHFNKRYITLAPIATVIGLAFKLVDPEHLIGDTVELGITCALIPRDTSGVTIGRRHLPTGAVFQNGPIQGKNVFIPLDFIIGGQAMAGQGWRMLMECLAAGRGISLPASTMGGSKVLVYGSGAYARVRRQFNIPIGYFEGVEAALARMTGFTYSMDATRSLTASFIDQGDKSAIASAITKYHVTELGRAVANDAMDIHGGKGICLGPKNYFARSWQALPIGITVEGANILTRNMIIFGQGAMRCHPYLFAELEAANIADPVERLQKFDEALWSHLYYSITNFFRAAVMAITAGKFIHVTQGKLNVYYRQAIRFSTAFAWVADLALLSLGGSLKRRENISARLGDVLSQLYMVSAVLKHYHDQGQPTEDLPVVEWACQWSLYQIQLAFSECFRNFPRKGLGWLMNLVVFPLGKHFHKPSDALSHTVAGLILNPTTTRERLTHVAFKTATERNMLAKLEQALQKTVATEPIEKKIKDAVKAGQLHGDLLAEQGEKAVTMHIISAEEWREWQDAEQARQAVIAVDDFSNEELHPSL